MGFSCLFICQNKNIVSKARIYVLNNQKAINLLDRKSALMNIKFLYAVRIKLIEGDRDTKLLLPESYLVEEA